MHNVFPTPPPSSAHPHHTNQIAGKNEIRPLKTAYLLFVMSWDFLAVSLVLWKI